MLKRSICVTSAMLICLMMPSSLTASEPGCGVAPSSSYPGDKSVYAKVQAWTTCIQSKYDEYMSSMQARLAEKAVELAVERAKVGRDQVAEAVVNEYGSGIPEQSTALADAAATKIVNGGTRRLGKASPVAAKVTRGNLLSSLKVMKAASSGFEAALADDSSALPAGTGWSNGASSIAHLGPESQPGQYNPMADIIQRQAEQSERHSRQEQALSDLQRKADLADAKVEARRAKVIAENALTPFQRQMRTYQEQQNALARASLSVQRASSQPSVSVGSISSGSASSAGLCEACR